MKGLYMGVRWQLDTLDTRPSGESVSPGSLLSLEVGSLSGWLAGVGDDEVGLRSSAGETLEGLVVANSSTNCSMSARGYFVGPEP